MINWKKVDRLAHEKNNCELQAYFGELWSFVTFVYVYMQAVTMMIIIKDELL